MIHEVDRREVGSTAASADVRLARSWADFTKALSIYPETNVRVRTALDRVREALDLSLAEANRDELRLRSRGVPILFRGGRLVCSDTEVELRGGTSLDWLAIRLQHGMLAGVEFLPELEPAALVEFTKRLLSIVARHDQEPEFTSLWPHRYTALVLVDRRFEGRFGGKTQAAPFRGGHANRGPQDSAESEMVAVLMQDEEIAHRLAQLEARAKALDLEDADTCKASDLLDRVLQYMPADALKDRRTLVAAIREVLEALEERLAESHPPDELSPLKNDMTLSALLYSVSRTHFARGLPDPVQATDPERDAAATSQESGAKRGHAGDDRIRDDPAELFSEMDALPAEPFAALTRTQGEVRGEEVAVLLHFLSGTDDAEHLYGLDPILGRLLEEPDEETLAVLRAHLDKEGLEAQTREGPVDGSPLFSFLRRTGRTALVRRTGIFHAEWVAGVFPLYFVPYLESLDLRKASDLADLDDACDRIGATRMRAALPALHDEGATLASDVAAHLLLHPSPTRLPLARLILDWHGEPLIGPVTTYLRKLDLEEDAALLLQRIPETRYLTLDYLRGLIDACLGGTRAQDLQKAIVNVLWNHIQGTRGAEARDPARLQSIESLADYPGGNTWFMLRQLSRHHFFRVAKREPAVVRRLARSLLSKAKAA